MAILPHFNNSFKSSAWSTVKKIWFTAVADVMTLLAAALLIDEELGLQSKSCFSPHLIQICKFHCYVLAEETEFPIGSDR